MGKYLLLILVPFFCLTALADNLRPEDDPNLNIGKLQQLHSKLPKLYVTSGVCTDPFGCDESETDQIDQVTGNVEGPFDQSTNSTGGGNPTGSSEESTNK